MPAANCFASRTSVRCALHGSQPNTFPPFGTQGNRRPPNGSALTPLPPKITFGWRVIETVLTVVGSTTQAHAGAASGTLRSSVTFGAAVRAAWSIAGSAFTHVVPPLSAHRSTTVTSPMYVVPPETPEKTTPEMPGPGEQAKRLYATSVVVLALTRP